MLRTGSGTRLTAAATAWVFGWPEVRGAGKQGRGADLLGGARDSPRRRRPCGKQGRRRRVAPIKSEQARRTPDEAALRLGPGL